ncbi:MAG: serine/threonine protein kinase [Myxococcaceae bacterium]|nr:serine/threonine protein kinase [Myxococcaceae bacterium]
MEVSSPSESPAPESVGQYRLLGRLAVGGMAEVYRAAAPAAAGASRIVVVKRMLPRIASDASARAMFAEEARLGAHVRHPNVVQVLDFGEADAHPYLVLEYVQGVDLWRLMRFLTRTGRQLTVSQALFIGREMLAGLHAVHEATDDSGARLGVVHRDVSPSNVLLSIHGEVKLGDLGIARARLREKFPNTAISERAKGKLGYLAPEQVRGGESDRRADIFSAGVVVAELLMGRPLFAGGSELAVLLAIRDSKVHPFLEFALTLPDGLGELVADALAQKPARRHASAELLSSRLLSYQTEPVEELRTAVAALVLEALDSGPGKLPMQLTPTRTVTDPDSLLAQYARHEAADSADELTPIQSVHTLSPLLELTPVPGGASYEVRTSNGARFGPWSFAQTVQALSTGHIGPLDRVSVDQSALRPLAEIRELARHLPSSTTTSGEVSDDLRLSGEILPLEGGGIVSALGRAAVERMTVLMLCERGGVRKEVYIKDGVPAFVTSNLASELLGEYLVGKNVITRGELDMALAVMPRFEGRLGDTLSALGLVEPVVLFRHIAEQVREKLLDLFLWPGGVCTHYHGVAPPPSGFPLNINGWDVLEEGVRRRVAAAMETERVAALRTRAIVPATGPSLTAMRSSLPAHLKRFLSELDRPLTVPELVLKLQPANDGNQPLHDALLLLHIGAVRFAA